MQNCQLPSVKTETPSIGLRDLEKFAEGWLLSGEIAQHSPATLANRRLYVRNLLWFLRRRKFESCGLDELRAFFAYFNTAHKDPEGRWGNSKEKQPVKPATVAAYHRHIRALFNWIVAEGFLFSSPIARISPPVDRPDTIEPFSDAQVNALLAVAKQSRHPRRDEAVIWFLLDTGARASEVCALRFRDIDISARRAMIQESKGGKARPISFGKTAAKALWQYLKDEDCENDDTLFRSERGDAMNCNGLQKLIQRLCKEAEIYTARCRPHTFAVSFLRSGGNQFSLMQQLGHTDLKMTSRYVKRAQADVARQHTMYSPADALRGKVKR